MPVENICAFSAVVLVLQRADIQLYRVLTEGSLIATKCISLDHLLSTHYAQVGGETIVMRDLVVG